MATDTGMSSGSAFESFTTGQWLILGGAIAVVAGAFLPWIAVPGEETTLNGLAGYELMTFSEEGISGSPIFNGVVTLVVAGIGAALVFLRDWDQTTKLGAAALGLVVLVIGGLVFSDPSTVFSVTLEGQAGMFLEAILKQLEPGMGVYLTLLGGLLQVAGGGLGYSSE